MALKLRCPLTHDDQASTELMALINSLCVMLRATPFHRENYARLILGVVIQFYQRCSDRFQHLVSLGPIDESEPEPRLSIAAQWAQKPELSPCLLALLNTQVCTLMDDFEVMA
jgi:exocyst complex component 4